MFSIGSLNKSIAKRENNRNRVNLIVYLSIFKGCYVATTRVSQKLAIFFVSCFIFTTYQNTLFSYIESHSFTIIFVRVNNFAHSFKEKGFRLVTKWLFARLAFWENIGFSKQSCAGWCVVRKRTIKNDERSMWTS